MLSESIPIGLFVLKNNRTMREQKSLQEGRKGYCPHVLFFGRLRAAREIGGVLRMGGYRRHGSQWVKN